MEVYEYLDQVEKQIRQEAVRKEIRTELGQHIEDQADFYQESGMSRAEAVERAVEDRKTASGSFCCSNDYVRTDKFSMGTGVCKGKFYFPEIS